MHDHRFDTWARSFASLVRRRDVTKTLAAGTLGALLVHFSGAAAAAKCINPGRPCDRKDKKRDACCGGAKCRGRRGRQECRCPAGRKPCRKACCPKGDICAGGRCVTGPANCPAGADSCAAGPIQCAGSEFCSCYQRLEGGTRCVSLTAPQGDCDQCANDADCRALGLPAGSSCIRDDGPHCGCAAGDRGYCGEPCRFVANAAVEVNRTSARRGPAR